MSKFLNIITKKINNKNIVIAFLIFLLLQPIFDILSFVYIKNIIPFGISTYIKPLFVFGVSFIIYIIDREERKKWSILYILFIFLIIGHLIILKRINTDLSLILHELRYMINIGYMLALYIILDYMYVRSNNKEELSKSLKKVLVITFIIYCVTILLAVITGTSARTYEYSDALKEGFKGWLDSGQIFGHALSICLPFIIFYLLNYKNENKIIKIIIKLIILMPVIVLCFIGTKVTLFICIIVLFIYIILSVFFFIKDKDKDKNNIINIIFSIFILCCIMYFYNYLPTPKNMALQQSVNNLYINQNYKEENWDNKYLELRLEEINEGEEKYDARTKYIIYGNYAIEKLKESYANGTVIPSDSRAKQLVYNYNKFMKASLEYKVLGLGYLNQPTGLVIERDILMIIFNFGILGFFLVFLIPISLWLRSIFCILKNIKNLNFEVLVLFEGFSIFFFISFYAGYTFIYTNFSIFLVTLMWILKEEVNKNCQ